MRAESIWRRWLAGALIAGLAVMGPGVTFAGGAPRSGTIDDRLRALEAEIEQLKRERAQQAAPEETPVGESRVKDIVDEAFKKQKVLAGWQDGFFLQSPGGDFKLKLRGYAQADGRYFADEDGDTGNSTFYMRRVRPILEGTVYKYFDFRIMPDFGQGQTVLQDAYGDIRYFPYASVRFGKFKPPVSLERLQSGSELTFIERSLVQNLVPNRDVGVQLYGDFFDGSLGYQVGIFNGTSDSEAGRDLDLTDDKSFDGRIFTVPFKTSDIDGLKGLGFGLAGTYAHENNESLSNVSYKTAGRSTYFTYNSDAKVVGRGAHWRIDPQLYWYWGPFGLMGEYVVSKQTVEGTAGGATRADYDAKGWFLQTSWVLTGEDNTYKSVVPINNFDPLQGRWGAFEIAARVANTDVQNDPLEEKVTTFTLAKGTTNAWAYTAGLNWYFNKNVKLQFNYERTDFAGAVTFGSNKRSHEDVLLTRFQISF